MWSFAAVAIWKQIVTNRQIIFSIKPSNSKDLKINMAEVFIAAGAIQTVQMFAEHLNFRKPQTIAAFSRPDSLINHHRTILDSYSTTDEEIHI